MNSIAQHPHRRRNVLTGDWVLVSPRTQRPWQGRREPEAGEDRPKHDPQCYLCPGNVRANGDRNPDYQSTFVFPNDFAALLADKGPSHGDQNDLFHAEPARGTCRVICFSLRHDLTLARMPLPAIRHVVDTWAAETDVLGAGIRHIRMATAIDHVRIVGKRRPDPHAQNQTSLES